MYMPFVVGVLYLSLFWYVLLCVHSSSAIILRRKRKLVALLSLPCRCIVTINVLWLFLAVPWVGLRCVIVIFPDHTNLLLVSSGISEEPGENKEYTYMLAMNCPVSFNIVRPPAKRQSNGVSLVGWRMLAGMKSANAKSDHNLNGNRDHLLPTWGQLGLLSNLADAQPHLIWYMSTRSGRTRLFCWFFFYHNIVAL